MKEAQAVFTGVPSFSGLQGVIPDTTHHLRTSWERQQQRRPWYAPRRRVTLLFANSVHRMLQCVSLPSTLPAAQHSDIDKIFWLKACLICNSAKVTLRESAHAAAKLPGCANLTSESVLLRHLQAVRSIASPEFPYIPHASLFTCA